MKNWVNCDCLTDTNFHLTILLFSWGSRITHSLKCNVASKQLPIKTRCTLAYVLCAASIDSVYMWSPVVHVLVTEETTSNLAVISCTQVQQSLTNVRLLGRWRLPAFCHGTDLCIELTLVRCCSSNVTLWFLLFYMCYFLHFAFNTCINCSFMHLSRYQLHVILWRRVCVQMFQLWILISVQISARLSLYSAVIFDWLSRVLLV